MSPLTPSKLTGNFAELLSERLEQGIHFHLMVEPRFFLDDRLQLPDANLHAVQERVHLGKDVGAATRPLGRSCFSPGACGAAWRWCTAIRGRRSPCAWYHVPTW